MVRHALAIYGLSVLLCAPALAQEDELVEVEVGNGNGRGGNPLERIAGAVNRVGRALRDITTQIEEVDARVEVVEGAVSEVATAVASAAFSVETSCTSHDVAQVAVCQGEDCQLIRYPCSPYACDPATRTCRRNSILSGHCADGSTHTDSGRCVHIGNTCSNLFWIRQANGTIVPCNGFKCIAGACQQQCTAHLDCKTDEGYQCVANLCVKQQVSGQ